MSASADGNVLTLKSELADENRSDKVRRSLRMVTLAWVFGAAWSFITTGAAFTQYAKALHVSEFGFGLLAAVPFFGALIQLPTSYVFERFGHRKFIFIFVGVIHRLSWSAVAVIPWIFPLSWWEGALVVMVGFAGLCGHVPTPGWISWMSELVPHGIRGRFFSRRTQLGQCIGIVVTIVTGVILDAAEVVSANHFLKIICLLLVISGISGAIDFLFFIPVLDTEKPKDPKKSPDVVKMYLEPLRDRTFVHFLGFVATLTFATGYMAQFLWLYLFDVVKVSNSRANVMLVVVPLAVMIICYRVWGRLIDRLGRKPVLMISSLMFVIGGAAWIFVQPGNWWLGYALAMFAQAAWPGIECGNFNMLLHLTTARNGVVKQSSVYAAINSVVVAVAGVLSGLFGGVLAHYLKDWHGSVAGVYLTYHSVLFLISTVLRFMAIFWLIGLQDTTASPTREALRYMMSRIFAKVSIRRSS